MVVPDVLRFSPTAKLHWRSKRFAQLSDFLCKGPAEKVQNIYIYIHPRAKGARTLGMSKNDEKCTERDFNLFCLLISCGNVAATGERSKPFRALHGRFCREPCKPTMGSVSKWCTHTQNTAQTQKLMSTAVVRDRAEKRGKVKQHTARNPWKMSLWRGIRYRLGWGCFFFSSLNREPILEVAAKDTKGCSNEWRVRYLEFWFYKRTVTIFIAVFFCCGAQMGHHISLGALQPVTVTHAEDGKQFSHHMIDFLQKTLPHQNIKSNALAQRR